jgi:signal transduction histidine kinase
VSIEIVESLGRVQIVVRDDGQGFDARAESGRFGLVGMRERVALLGGTLSVESSEGVGTTVRADFQAEHRRADEPEPVPLP